MIKRAIYVFVFFGLLHALRQLNGPGRFIEFAIAWFLTGWVVYRAWPHLRDDIGGLPRLRLPRRGRTDRRGF